MADSTNVSPLATLLGMVGWTPQRLGHRLNAFAVQQQIPDRIHPKTPYKWVAGDVPRPPWRALTAALLSEVTRREVTVDQLGWPADDLECVPADSGLLVPWDADGTLRALRAVTQAGVMDRRLFLMLLGSAATPPAHEWLIAHQAGPVAQAGGARVPMEVVDHLDQITARLRRMDDQLGGGQMLALVHQHLRYVTGLLNEHRYTDTVGRRLHGAAGELLRLAGFICFDSGLHARAQRYWIAALHAAHTAGDHALGANILGFWSCQAKDIGQIREAITLAETARAGYRGAAPAVPGVKGDVLVPAVARRPVARVAEDEETGAYPGPNVYVLRPDELVVDPWFLAGMLSTGEGARQIARASSSIQRALRIDPRRLRLPVLPIEIQRRFGAEFRRVARFTKLLHSIRETGDDLVEATNTLLTAPFTGNGDRKTPTR